MPSKRISLFRDESGAALVEFAITLPILVMLGIGAVELGRALATYHAVEKSLRGATRYLARVPESSLTTWGLQRAQWLAVYGSTAQPVAGTTEPLVSEWDDPAAVTLSPNPPSLPVIRLQTTLNIDVGLLQAIGLPGSISVPLSHEERHVGE